MRYWEHLEELVVIRLSCFRLETVTFMSGLSWEISTCCFSAPIPRKSNKVLYVILQSKGGMGLSKASNLTIWESHRSTKKPRRLLISAHDVISVTRRKASRASEIESPMSLKLSFCGALTATALRKTEVQRYAIGARAAIGRWNRLRRFYCAWVLSKQCKQSKNHVVGFWVLDRKCSPPQ